MFKMLSSRRGISPILATLLLIVIAVAAVIVTYAWVMTFTTTQTQQAGAILVRENVRFYGEPALDDKNRADIVIRNTGTADAKIVATYWSNASYADLNKLKTNEFTLSPDTGVVSAGSSITITLEWGVSGGSITEDEWVSGKTYYFKVVTEAGPYLEFVAKAP